MSEVSRSPWGEEATSRPDTQQRLPTFRALLVLLLGLLTAVVANAILDMMDLTWGVRPGAKAEEVEVVRWALAATIAAIAELAFLFSPLLPVPISVKAGRLFRIIVAILAAGIALAAVTYLAMGFLVPESSPGEKMVLPGLIAVFFGILAAFSPVMPIWPVNVPDNQVWMILDNNDHLVRYVAAGVHMIRPLQGYAPYKEAGVMVISIDDDSFVSSDAFPYRVRANVACMFTPLKADPGMWVTLRDMTKDLLTSILKTDIEYIIRFAVAQYVREGIQLAQVLNTISHQIEAAVKSRANFGVTLVPTNPIHIILDPPEMVVDARQRRMSVEALALPDAQLRNQPLRDLLRLIAPDSDLKMDVNAQGQINFALTPGDDIEIGESLEQAIMGAASAMRGLPARQTPPALPRHEPLAIPPDLSDTQPVSTPTASTTSESEEKKTGKAKTEQAAKSETVIPPNPIGPKPDHGEDVIDTDLDSQGVYIPRNPLGPKKPD